MVEETGETRLIFSPPAALYVPRDLLLVLTVIGFSPVIGPYHSLVLKTRWVSKAAMGMFGFYFATSSEPGGHNWFLGPRSLASWGFLPLRMGESWK